MKNLDTQNFSTLGVNEMFNVRGGDGNTTANNSTAQGVDKDIIL